MSTPDDRTIQTRWIQVSPRFTLDTKDLKVTEYRDVESEPIKPTWSERVRALLGRSSDNLRDRSPRLRRQKIHTYDFNNTELPLKIFMDRMAGWFFEPAEDLLQKQQDVAAVHLVTPMIEALEQRYKGVYTPGHSRQFFNERADIMFSLRSNTVLDLLYGGLRCGFAHHGFLKDDTEQYNILITRGLSKPVEYNDGILWIDAPQYVAEIRKAFEKYYARVGYDADLLQKFMKSWNDDWQMSLRVPGAGGTTSATVP